MPPKNIFLAFVWTLLGTFAVCTVIALFGGAAGCGRSPAAPLAASTARVIAFADVRAELPGAICGDTAYAEVNSAWLRSFYAEFQAEIFRKGVTSWDARFDCNHFATYYAALAQTKFYLVNFQSRTTAQSLAVGAYWYHSARGNHAIVCALTERGLVFVEPQTGAEMQLTPAERASAFLTVF